MGVRGQLDLINSNLSLGINKEKKEQMKKNKVNKKVGINTSQFSTEEAWKCAHR